MCRSYIEVPVSQTLTLVISKIAGVLKFSVCFASGLHFDLRLNRCFLIINQESGRYLWGYLDTFGNCFYTFLNVF